MIGMRTAAAAAPEPLTPVRSGTRRVVLVSLGLQIPQTAALAVAAILTGSAALVAQTFAATADLAVQAFLVIGVRASSREADETHPVGYGRERYFWALYAALAIFVSGFTVAVAEALRDVLNPTPVASFGSVTWSSAQASSSMACHSRPRCARRSGRPGHTVARSPSNSAARRSRRRRPN